MEMNMVHSHACGLQKVYIWFGWALRRSNTVKVIQMYGYGDCPSLLMEKYLRFPLSFIISGMSGHLNRNAERMFNKLA